MSDFNQNNDDEDIVVTLDLDDGSQVECEILTIFTIGERDYIALLPLDENVYIIDVNEGVMPYKKAVLEPEVEEERRMFYVGMTRAKKNLHLFSVRQLNHKDAEISRFIKEAQPPEKKKD